MAAFLCGWSFFTGARSAEVAWLAVVFSMVASYFLSLGAVASKALSLLVILVFTWANYRGVKLGVTIQKSFAAAKVAGALIIIGAAFLASGRGASSTVGADPSSMSLSSFGVALISCLLAY